MVESTTLHRSVLVKLCCDLLEISYLCGRINNAPLRRTLPTPVVICSKFPTFVVESTTRQLSAEELAGCDLLEISYLCGRINNRGCVKIHTLF